MTNETETIDPMRDVPSHPGDGELLRRHIDARDEAALGELVRRHVDLVYSVALRRLNGDAHGAGDVTQQVFIALVRHAGRLGRDVVLPAWLYTTTRNLSANFVRAEQSRRKREREAHLMNELNATGPNADWEHLRPLLDEVIDELGEADRSAVLLRFFARRPFAEIGASLRVSEDAARMRVDRALEKLRASLGRRGIASTGAALAVLLANHAVAAAPAGLAAASTGAALGGGAATGAVTFMAITKFQLGLGAAVLGSFLAGVLVTKYTTLAGRQEAAAFETGEAGVLAKREGAATSGKASATKTGASASDGRAGVGAGAGGVTAAGRVGRGQLQAETAAALQRASVPEKYLALLSILQRLTPGNWREVLTAFAEERKATGLAHSEAFELFVRRAGEVAGQEAVGYFLTARNLSGANQALMGWASKNPAEALAWLGRDVEPDARRSLLGAAIRGLALSEPDLAIRTLEDLPAKERGRYTEEFVTSMLRGAGIDRTQELVEGMIARASAAGTQRESYLKNVVSDYSLLRLPQAAASGTLPDMVAWLDRQVGQPYVDHRVIAAVTERLASQDPRATLQWLEGVNTTLLRAGDDSTAGYRVLLQSWAGKEGASAVESWLQAQTGHPHYDHLAYQWTALIAGRDAEKAAQWAGSIKSETIRQEALALIAARRKNE